jgi:hypothetical protein
MAFAKSNDPITKHPSHAPNALKSLHSGRSPMPGKDRVIGVYKHVKGWEIKIVLDGKRRSRYRKDRNAADELAADLALQLQGPASLPGAEVIDNDANDARAGWTDALEMFRDRIVKNPGDARASEALRVLSTGASAAAKMIDAESRRRRLEALEREVKQIRGERKSGQDAKRNKRRDKTGKAKSVLH